MATEVEQLYLQLELINIEEQMLILQMLKRRRQRRRLRRWCVRSLTRSRLGTGEFTTPVHPLRDLDEQMHFLYFQMSTGQFHELLRRVQPLRKKSNCQKLRSEQTNHSRCGLRQLDAYLGFFGGARGATAEVAVDLTQKHKISLRCGE